MPGSRLASAATVAGAVWAAQWVVFLSEPTYAAPESSLDYAAVIVLSLALFATAVALVVVQREVAPKRSSVLVLLAGIAVSVTGIANLLEKAFGVAAAGNVFIYGGFAFFGTLALGGVMIVMMPAPQKWVGLVLLVSAAAYSLGLSAYMAIAWLWLASAARRGRFDQITHSQ